MHVARLVALLLFANLTSCEGEPPPVAPEPGPARAEVNATPVGQPGPTATTPVEVCSPGRACAPKDKICQDAGGAADCSKPPACAWRRIGGNKAIAAGAAVCHVRSVAENDTHVRIVKRVHDPEDGNCCGTSDKPCDVEQVYSGTVGYPSRGASVLRVTVPQGKVACVQAGHEVEATCTPGCVP